MKFVEIDRDGIFARVFTNANGQEESCLPTGRELHESDSPADWWIEYVDSLGDLHYGR